MNDSSRQFLVLGGAGAIGRIIVRDLVESLPRCRVIVADFDGVAAQAVALSYRDSSVRGVQADARNIAALVRVLRGNSVVINCTRHQLNLNVMEAALAARVSYLDLGGLF